MKTRKNFPKLTENAKQVLESRYLMKNEQGKIIESPKELFSRVALAVASIEGKNQKKWAAKFFEMMSSLRFLPNSPTLMNAGRPQGQLSACFVLPIEDSLESIFDTLKYSAKIHQSGGGTGFSFSRLRPKGSPVRTTSGVASGPVSFMKIYDVTTDTIKQGGTRRGANMAILRVDHPDVEEFVLCKIDGQSIRNFNISVGITDEFIEAVLSGKKFALKDPHSGQVVKKVSASKLFRKIAESAWSCGDPGLIFLDQINRFNPTPQIGEIESTNPCGEQPLLPFESCNLGSLNLGKYWEKNRFQWGLFKKDIQLAVRFLDNVIDLNVYPIIECRQITLRNRKIGLGIMGLADLLLMMGIPYGSEEARKTSEKIMGFLNQEAKKTSADLAKVRGAFPNWKGSLWDQSGMKPLRNATVTTVAPTGTISMIAGASSGIEPIFSGYYFRNVLDGKRLVEIHPSVQTLLKKKRMKIRTITDQKLAELLGPAWSPARLVSVEDHVKMQAVFQKYSDSAVSKTINLPETASIEDVEHAYLLAYELGCKGITVYRDRCRPTQVLETVDEDTSRNKQACPIC